MRNSKKKLGLIALCACLLTGAIAFAAFNSLMTINATVETTTTAMPVYFATADGETVGDIEPIVRNDAGIDPPPASGSTISIDNSTTLSGATVTLVQVGDRVVYRFKIKNTSTETAYLHSIDMPAFTDQFAASQEEADNSVSGGTGSAKWFPGGYFKFYLEGNRLGPGTGTSTSTTDSRLISTDGSALHWDPVTDGTIVSIAAGESYNLDYVVEWRVPQNGAVAPRPPVGEDEITYTIKLSDISMEWTNVKPPVAEPETT